MTVIDLKAGIYRMDTQLRTLPDSCHFEESLDHYFNSKASLNGVNLEAVIDELIIHIDKLRSKNKFKIISLIGGAASGKSTFAGRLVEGLVGHGIRASVISTDDYLRGDRKSRRAEGFEMLETKSLSPEAKYDWEFLNETINRIAKLKDGQDTGVPTYNKKTGEAIGDGIYHNYQKKIGKSDVLIVEGDFDKVDNPTLKLYLHALDRTRKQNRITRDIRERGETDVKKIVESFNLRQKTQHIPFTQPAAARADILIKVSSENTEDWRFSLFETRTSSNKGLGPHP